MAARTPKSYAEVPRPEDPTGKDAPQVPGAFTRPPKAGEVDAMWRYKLADYEELGLRRYIGEVRALVDMRQPVQIPREYRVTTKEVRTPYMRDAARRIAAALTKDRPIPKANPRDGTNAADDAADITARWLDATWEAIIDQNNGEDLIYKSSLNLVTDSESVLKVVDRANAWANFPAQDTDEPSERYLSRRERNKQRPGQVMPFAARIVDRLNCVFGGGEYGDTWCVEYGLYPAPIIMNEYGLGPTNADPKYTLPQYRLDGKPVAMGYPARSTVGGMSGMTVKLEYFDKDWWAVVINGEMAPGWPKANPYAPTLPYFRAVMDPALYSLRYLVPAIDALLTGKMNWAFLSMFPVPKFHPVASNQQTAALDMPIGDEATTPVGMRWKPGMAMMPPPGYDLEFLEVPPTGRDVDALVGILRELVDIAGIPSLMRGIGGARQAGYAVNQLLAAANLSYRQGGRALSRQFERASEFILDIVEDVIEEPVYVLGEVDETKTWLGVKPTGNVTENVAPLDMVATIEFRFKPVIPTDEQAMEMIGVQALNSPHQVLSHETVLRDYFQLEDPQGEMDRIAVEKEIDTNPQLHDLVVGEAMRKAGINPPPPPPPPSGLLGPNGMPLPPSGAGGPLPPQPDGQVASGMPSIPGLTMPLQPPPHPATQLPHAGGTPAGSFPGRPSGPERA